LSPDSTFTSDILHLLGKLPKTILADAGYGGEENYEYLEKEEREALVKRTRAAMSYTYAITEAPTVRAARSKKRAARRAGTEKFIRTHSQPLPCAGRITLVLPRCEWAA